MEPDDIPEVETGVTYNYSSEEFLPMFTIDQQLRMTALQSAVGAGIYGSAKNTVEAAEAFYVFLAATPT